MNPYTGQTARLDSDLFRTNPDEERARAAREVGLDDPDDLVLIEGKPEHVDAVADAVKARAKAKRRAANKRARSSRKANRRG